MPEMDFGYFLVELECKDNNGGYKKCCSTEYSEMPFRIAWISF